LHYNTTNYIGYGTRRGQSNGAAWFVVLVFVVAYLLTR